MPGPEEISPVDDLQRPTPDELDEIERIKDQGHFGSHEAQNRVLGNARADAWRALHEPSLEHEPTNDTSSAGVPLNSRREQRESNLRLARLANEATQSELGAKEFLTQQPPSPERDKLLEGFKDSEAA